MLKETEILEADAQKNENNASQDDNNIVKAEPSGDESAPRDINIEEAIEAILFAAGHPVQYSSLARVFSLTPAKVKDIVFEYSLKYNDPSIPRGVILLTYSDSCQLCTKQNYLPEIREALGIRKSGTLSTSSMEALAIVAYNQPVTRLFVDTLRRADSSYAMNNLIDRGLIECKGRLDVPGRPMLYGTTSDFLRAFGLSGLDALPQTTEELMAVFESTKTETEAARAEENAPEQQTMDELIDAAGAAPDAVAEDSADSTESTHDTDGFASEAEDASAEDDVIND